MRSFSKKSLVTILCALLLLTLIPTAVFADEVPKEHAPEPVTWTPSGIDLRDRGVVTPVKLQNPWSTCWSFGAIAAAETSILSASGTTFEETALDFSERHLAYFAMHPIDANTNESQAGEGIRTFVSDEENPNACFISTNPILSSTLFSSGVGPLLEFQFPYRGNEGFTEYEYMRDNKEEWIRDNRAAIDEAVGRPVTDEEVELIYQRYLAAYEVKDNYSRHDNWSLKMEDRNLYEGYTLTDGNTLPRLFNTNQAYQWAELNPEGINAVKTELENGRAVAISFCADTSSPGEDASTKYINHKTWAHYTYNPDDSANHMVCIVGYDDNYPKENFAHKVEGLSMEDSIALTTPAGNGAWIVKNSWGSETEDIVNENERPVTRGPWGVMNEQGKHTGYFYLSYYDKSTTFPETFEFATDLDGDYFTVEQYDFLPAVLDFFYEASNERMATANEFDVEEDSVLTSVGIRTPFPNCDATIFVVKLNANAKDPSDGEVLSAFEYKDIQYSGFHRIALPKEVSLKAGDRIALISESMYPNTAGSKSYAFSVNLCPDETFAKRYKMSYYGVSVINEGESFLYKDGQWVDWTDYLKTEAFSNRLSELQWKDVIVDNFTIKGYLIPDTAPDSVDDPTGKQGETIEPNVPDSTAPSNQDGKKKKSPKTGENNMALLWIAVAVSGAAFAGGIAICRKSKKSK